MNFPEILPFAAVIADPRFAWAVLIATVAGLVRGFSGFGSGLIHVPLIAMLYSPRVAAITIVLMDLAGAAPLSLRAFPKCNWRDVLPMMASIAIAAPFGAMTLAVLDPVMLRWFIAFLILVLLVPLTLGWRYQGEMKLSLTAGVGMFAGFGAGAVQIMAPPIVLYWLGAKQRVETARANFMVLLLFADIFGIALYAFKGLMTPADVALSLLLAPPFFIAMACGGYFFRGASDEVYRRIAYAIIAFAALSSLPLFDRFLR